MPLVFLSSLKVKVMGVSPTTSLTLVKFASESLSLPKESRMRKISERQNTLEVNFE